MWLFLTNARRKKLALPLDVEWFRVDEREQELDHAPRPDAPPASDGG